MVGAMASNNSRGEVGGGQGSKAVHSSSRQPRVLEANG